MCCVILLNMVNVDCGLDAQGIVVRSWQGIETSSGFAQLSIQWISGLFAASEYSIP